MTLSTKSDKVLATAPSKPKHRASRRQRLLRWMDLNFHNWVVVASGWSILWIAGFIAGVVWTR